MLLCTHYKDLFAGTESRWDKRPIAVICDLNRSTFQNGLAA